MQTAGIDFREALMIFETPQYRIGADLTDMYIANVAGLLLLLNWAREQAQTMRGSRISSCLVCDGPDRVFCFKTDFSLNLLRLIVYHNMKKLEALVTEDEEFSDMFMENCGLTCTHDEPEKLFDKARNREKEIFMYDDLWKDAPYAALQYNKEDFALMVKKRAGYLRCVEERYKNVMYSASSGQSTNDDSTFIDEWVKNIIIFLTSQCRQWTDTKSARCSEGKNHDTQSDFQGPCNDAMSKRLGLDNLELFYSCTEWVATCLDFCPSYIN